MFVDYEVLDDFLKPEHFNIIKDLDLGKLSNNEIQNFSNKFYKNNKIENSCLDPIFIKDLFESYHNKCLSLLEKLNKKKMQLWDYSEFQIVETGSHYEYPIHRDSPLKLLSGIVYISPNENTGTLLYSDKSGNNKKEILWKPNRALFFSRDENNSFHSYEGNKKSTRRALVYNLMTNDLKKVCEIENVNFYKVKSRELINPYIQKFLNKVL